MKKKALLGRLSDVDFRLLRVFRAVAACGGVTAAELELNIGRSTISRHLTDLEYRLGVKLCHRGPSGFSLTQEGQKIHDAALNLFAAVHEFQAQVDETNENLTGHISMAMFDKLTTNPAARISEAIRIFEEKAPDVTMEMHIVPINAIETGVINGRFQLGIVASHKKSDNLDYYPMYAEEMYLYCGKHHPLFQANDEELTDADVSRHKYTGFAFNSPNMKFSHELNLRRSADVNNEEALLALVLSGRYTGFLPDHYALRFEEKGELRKIRPEIYHYRSDHSAIIRHVPRMPRRVERFLECLSEVHGH